jgi:hypothetical protein
MLLQTFGEHSAGENEKLFTFELGVTKYGYKMLLLYASKLLEIIF